MAESITAGYRTAVVFDKFSPVVNQPHFAWQRRAEEIARGDTGPQSNVFFIPGIGIILKPDHAAVSGPYELTDQQGGYLTGAAVQVPAAVTMQYTARKYDYTGVTYVGVADQSQPMFRKKVADGASWDIKLDVDEAAFPGPAKWEDATDVDRMLVTIADHDPRDQVSFRMHVPGAAQDRPGGIGNLYFNGPAGKGRRSVYVDSEGLPQPCAGEKGLGQYALKLQMDGIAKLYERGYPLDADGEPIRVDGEIVYTWFKRWQFTYMAVPASGMAVHIVVATDCVQDGSGSFIGTKIAFMTLHATEFQWDSKGKLLPVTLVSGKSFHVFPVPRLEENPVQVEKLRIDVRRDLRAEYGVSKVVYPTSGEVVDDVFTLPFHPTPDEPLRLEWYGPRPTGTTLGLKLYRADDGTEIAGTVTIDDEFGQVIEFTPPVDMPRAYFAKFEKTGPGTSTPILREYRVYREAVVETPDYPVITVHDDRGPLVSRTLPTLFPTSVECAGVSEDPETENIKVTIVDMVGEDLTLPFKTGTPINVELHDPDDDSLITVVSGGIIQRSTKEVIGFTGKAYPNSDAYRLEIDASGEWGRAKRWLLPARFVANDPDDPSLVIKATKAVEYFFHKAGGVPLTELDIPDLPQRLFTEVGGESLQTVEPGSLAFEQIKEIIQDYTGGYVIRDKNAGHDTDTPGMWRLLLRNRPPYNNLLKIYRDHPGAGKLPHVIASYLDGVGPGGQAILATYAMRDDNGKSERTTFEPPEGNFVQVFGGSGAGSSVGGMHPGMLSQVAFNPVSFNYLNLPSSHDFYPDPSNPDFLGECVQIQVYDYTLNTQAAVDWVCRRVFDSACYGREVVKVKCPIRLVTDITDTLQQRPRLPRFNDPVQYQQPDGSFGQYLVVSCNPKWDFDGLIVMEMELVTTTNINTYGLPIGAFDMFDLSRARIKAAKTAGGTPPRTRQNRLRNREFYVNSVAFTGWPAGIPTELQYMNPEEETFGQFKYMVDYDPVP